METVIKAAAICIPAAFIAQALKKDSPVMSLAILTAAAFFAAFTAASALGGIAESVGDLAQTAGINSAALAVVLKTLGISVVARLTADVLKDAGMGSAASAVELTGSAAGIFAALPLIKSVLEMVRGLL